MKIPLSQYQLAHARKAVFAGVGMVGTAITTALANGVSLTELEHWPAIGGLVAAFVVGFVGTFNIPNKDFRLVEKVIEEINPVLGEKVAVLLDPALAAREPTDHPAVEQIAPAQLVAPTPLPSGTNSAAVTVTTVATPLSTPEASGSPQPVDSPGPAD